MKLVIHNQFIKPILNGTCIHLIGNLLNADNDHYFVPGMPLQLFKKASSLATDDIKFCDKHCTGSQSIVFSLKKDESDKWFAQIFIDGHDITSDLVMLRTLAVNTGFSNINDFLTHKLWSTKQWSGKIIHFTDFRYQFKKPVVDKFTVNPKLVTNFIDNIKTAIDIEHVEIKEPTLASIPMTNWDILYNKTKTGLIEEFKTQYKKLSSEQKIKFYATAKNELTIDDLEALVNILIEIN